MRRGVTTQLVTVLFTDIVASTDITREVGDRRWRELVAAHHRIVRRALKRHRGRELDTAGDGFFASFSRPAQAIRCALEVSEGVRELGLEIRAGLHLGEAEVMGQKVGGVAVNTGARIMGVGKEGEILVSSTVRDAVAGKGIEFVDHGVHHLKGLDGEYRLFDVTAVDGVARGLPLDPREARRRRERPLPEPVRRRPWWLVAAGAAMVVAAAIGFATSLEGSDEERTGTGATGATAGRELTDADREVIGLVSTSFADTCAATDPLPTNAVGSVTCTDGDHTVRYDTYADPQRLDAAFTAATAGLDLRGASCRDDPAAGGFYRIDGTQRGSVACVVDRSTALAFVSRIVWTDDDLLVLGAASREDVTDFRGSVPDLSLYEWWRTSTGPGPGGSFRAKDDPAEVPSGTFRSVIIEDQVGPIDEGGASERWVGTWTITLDGGTFVESFQDGLRQRAIVGEEATEDQSYEIPSGLLWGKGNRMILRRDYTFPPLGGPGDPCRSYESLGWSLDGDRLVFSRPSPEPECRDFRNVAVFQPWQRVA